MKISEYTKEMMNENSFIDMAYIYLQEQGKDVTLYDIVDEFQKIGGYKDAEIENRVLQFYTDLNTDGRFLSAGDNLWGLRDWYSVDDIAEKITPTIQKFEQLEVEEEPELKLLGEEEDDDELKVIESDENLEDPEDEEVEDDIEEAGLVVEEEYDEDFEENEEDEEEESQIN